MEAVAASVIAVLGTLFGSALTHGFQRRTANQAERFARNERLRQERLDAYSALGGALMNYRRGVMDRWYAEKERRSQEVQHTLKHEALQQRTAAQEAMFRVELLTDDPRLVEAGHRLVARIAEIRRAQSEDEFEERRGATHALIHELITSSKAHVTTLDRRT